MGRARDLSLPGYHRWEGPGICLCRGHHRWEGPGVCLCQDLIDGKSQGYVFAGTSYMGRARGLSLLGHHRWEEPGVCLCQDLIDGKGQGFVFAGTS